MPSPTPQTVERIVADASRIASAALQQIAADHPWYVALSAQDRSSVGLVAQAGVAGFVAWLRAGEVAAGSEMAAGPGASVEQTGGDVLAVFGSAPRELTRSVSLARTLELLRTAVTVVERQVSALAAPDDEASVREAILRYSREIAFAAAQVYAEAAEARGAWDARLEALVLDAVLRGVADDGLRSRAAALGWDAVGDVTAIVGSSPADRDSTVVIDEVRRSARRLGVEVLAGVQGRRLIVVVGGTRELGGVLSVLLEHFGDGPVVHAMTVPHLFAAGRSVRSALAGLAAAPAWPGAPRPVAADDLLAERALAGEERARRVLVEEVYQPLAEQPILLETVDAFLASGRLEQAARDLFVHPNTVRYRLSKVAAATGLDVTRARDGFTVRLAVAWGRLAQDPVEPAIARDAYRAVGVRHTD